MMHSLAIQGKDLIMLAVCNKECGLNNENTKIDMFLFYLGVKFN